MGILDYELRRCNNNIIHVVARLVPDNCLFIIIKVDNLFLIFSSLTLLILR